MTLKSTRAAEASSTWTTRAVVAGTTEVGAARATLGSVLATEEVQTVDDMEHGVARDGVVLRIRATHRADRADEGGLLLEDIIELQGDGERPALEEALRDLRIPDELVGIHRRVVIASATLHVDVRGEGGAPWGRDTQHRAISELPRVEVVLRLQVVARMGVGQRAVEFELEPVVAVAGS